MLEVKPGTGLIEIPACGHVPSLMNRDEVEIVGNFLRGAASERDEPRQSASSSRAA
jgi:hypothetical protein